MTGKTHYVVGVSAVLLSFPPKDIDMMATEIVLAMIGSGISDIDVSGKFARTRIKRYLLLLVVLIALLVLKNRYINKERIFSIPERKAIIALIVIGIIITFICIFGCAHRTFTHSILFMAIMCFSLLAVDRNCTIWFTTGFLTHLILDFMNRMPIKLFYPFGRGNCLYLCRHNGIVNEVLFWLGIAVVSILVTYYISKFCFNKDLFELMKIGMEKAGYV